MPKSPTYRSKPQRAARSGGRAGEVIADYYGSAWNRGICRIGSCGYTVHAADYHAARTAMAAHREEVHG